MKWLSRKFYALLLDLLVRRVSKTGRVHCVANRQEYTLRNRTLELKLVLRDLSERDNYSREELYEMLRTVRKYEAIQGWRVPEPGEIRDSAAGSPSPPSPPSSSCHVMGCSMLQLPPGQRHRHSSRRISAQKENP